MAVTINSKHNRIFKDLDFAFIANPNTGDIVKKFDEDAIKASVKNLILTRNYERLFHSEIGSLVMSLLFEPAGPMLNNILKRAIEDTITAFEPRVILKEVNVISDSDNNSVYVFILFTIVNTTQPVKLDLILERTR